MANSRPKKSRKREYVQLANLASIGIGLVVSTMIGYGIGAWIDSRLHTAPWFLLTFLLLGIGAGYLNIFRTINRDMNSPDEKNID